MKESKFASSHGLGTQEIVQPKADLAVLIRRQKRCYLPRRGEPTVLATIGYQGFGNAKRREPVQGVNDNLDPKQGVVGRRVLCQKKSTQDCRLRGSPVTVVSPKVNTTGRSGRGGHLDSRPRQTMDHGAPSP